jgi:hypothetical protein
MADELELITINEDGNSWVDLIPDEFDTGYQAQNTNIEAIRNGFDLFDVIWDGGASELVISPSGIADDNGEPIVVKTEVRISIPSDNTWYLKIIAGSDATKRSLSLVTTPGTWDESKNGYYDSGDRIIDWVIIKEAGVVTPRIYKRINNNTEVGLFLKFLEVLDIIKTDKVTQNTPSGADDEILRLSGGGDSLISRGALINLLGVNFPSVGGTLELYAGNAASGNIDFFTLNAIRRMRIQSGGGVIIDNANSQVAINSGQGELDISRDPGVGDIGGIIDLGYWTGDAHDYRSRIYHDIALDLLRIVGIGGSPGNVRLSGFITPDGGLKPNNVAYEVIKYTGTTAADGSISISTSLDSDKILNISCYVETTTDNWISHRTETGGDEYSSNSIGSTGTITIPPGAGVLFDSKPYRVTVWIEK